LITQRHPPDGTMENIKTAKDYFGRIQISNNEEHHKNQFMISRYEPFALNLQLQPD